MVYSRWFTSEKKGVGGVAGGRHPRWLLVGPLRDGRCSGGVYFVVRCPCGWVDLSRYSSRAFADRAGARHRVGARRG